MPVYIKVFLMGCVLDLIFGPESRICRWGLSALWAFLHFSFYTTFPRKHRSTMSSEQPSIRIMPENAAEWLHVSKTKSLLLPDRLPCNWLRAAWAVPPGSCGLTFGPPSQYQSGSPGWFDSVLSSNSSYIHRHILTQTHSHRLRLPSW